MISLKKNFIFVHTPKTAGTSISKSLSKYCEAVDDNGRQVYNGHSTKHLLLDGYYRIAMVLRNTPSDLGDMDSYYKFTVVRNPWDRMISYYFWLNKEFNREKFVNMLTKSRRQGKCGSCDFADKSPLHYNFSSCTQYCVDIKKIDKFIRFENLEEGFKEVCKDIDIPAEKLGWFNKSEKERDYRDYYDDETRLTVETAFADDIANFNYEFGAKKWN